MTKETIEKLPDVLKDNICEIKKTSSYDNGKGNMTESHIKVVNFDNVPKEYTRGKGWKCVPKSNDALYVTEDGQWYFIEFKNGSIDCADVYRKIYDSIIVLIELNILPGFEFLRQNGCYILVYNSGKYGKIPSSEGRDANYAYILERAEMEQKLFGVEKFEEYLFKETHTYTKKLFEECFIKPMELHENAS